MALVNCPECKKQISDKAINCIHCGYPMQKKNDSIGHLALSIPGDNGNNTNVGFIFSYEKEVDNYRYKEQEDIISDVESHIRVYNMWCQEAPYERQEKMYKKMALIIFRITIKTHFYMAWTTVRYLMEKIDFSFLGSYELNYMADKLYSISGANENIVYSYIINQLIKHGDEGVKTKMKSLGPCFTSEKIYVNFLEKRKDNGKKEIREDIPKCPHCNAVEIKKLDVIDRGISIGLFGLGSNKIGKSFECKKCKYTW